MCLIWSLANEPIRVDLVARQVCLLFTHLPPGMAWLGREQTVNAALAVKHPNLFQQPRAF